MSEGLAQARQVFLQRCGLPQAWAGQPQWRILDTRFGEGLKFLSAWHAWKLDPERPRLLHYVAIDDAPECAGEILLIGNLHPELSSLVSQLGAQWTGLGPGVHRLAFEGGRVLLTLHAHDLHGTLRAQPFTVDSVFLEGTARLEAQTMKALARHCRRGAKVSMIDPSGQEQSQWASHGFVFEGGHVVFSPSWEPKGLSTRANTAPGNCVVIGSGLAGAAVAGGLALRGWQVTVLDAGDAPAAGASGLPVGLLAPHYSSDDNLLSRLTRAGVRATLLQARALLREGEDWQLTGVREVRPGEPDRWHEDAGWIKPATLVRAWLAQPGISWRGRNKVASITRSHSEWQVQDERGETLARAPLVVVAAAYASETLLKAGLPLQPVRGQVSWGWHDVTPGALDSRLRGNDERWVRGNDERYLRGNDDSLPLKGNGHFIPGVPQGSGRAWYCGSTYDREDTDLAAREGDHAANLERLRTLSLEVATRLEPAFRAGEVHAWTGVRCASSNRRPLTGEVAPGLWVSTAMGSRGLTFCALCAEIITAQVHGEPLPIELRLAQSLRPRLAVVAEPAW
jgi:tRNA 5-methylaminomethyl-2-thiouridine biosynthesis bifunctional protein